LPVWLPKNIWLPKRQSNDPKFGHKITGLAAGMGLNSTSTSLSHARQFKAGGSGARKSSAGTSSPAKCTTSAAGIKARARIASNAPVFQHTVNHQVNQ
jgi:hypothetical protein